MSRRSGTEAQYPDAQQLWQEKPLNGRTVAVTQLGAASPTAGQPGASAHNSFAVNQLQTTTRDTGDAIELISRTGFCRMIARGYLLRI